MERSMRTYWTKQDLKLPKKTTTYSKEEENIYQKLKEDKKYYIWQIIRRKTII